ncbi:unnamed protein product [Urochloa decumbens]|uniref:Uncharacterized protein n=1 Tax=Urochloa decumbens TaxID=240449 RepID=A0ABC9AXH1_9POAL
MPQAAQDNAIPIGLLPQPNPEEPLLAMNDFMQADANHNLDLNQPPEEDLGGVEEDLNLAADNWEAEQGVQEEVFYEGEPSDDSAEQPVINLDLNEENNVEVFIPMDNGAPRQMIPDEVQEHELMNNLGGVAHDEDPFNQDMQIGMQHAAAVRAWAQHLAPGLGAPSVNVPKPWADFFTALLLNPGNFTWAKSLLSSPAWEHFQQPYLPSVQFALPEKCPKGSTSECLDKVPFSMTEMQFEEADPTTPSKADKGKEIMRKKSSPCTPPDQRGSRIFPSTGPWSKALLAQAAKTKSFAALVDSDLRRSERKEEQHKGFKHGTCLNKDCLGCASKPPTVPPSVIRNLGVSFCKVDPSKLTEEALGMKRKASAPGGKKPTVKKTPKEPDNDDTSKTKKINKKQPKK